MIEGYIKSFLYYLRERPWLVVVLCLLLLLPALLINLGVMPLLVDEPIRALVALEMIDSGEYFVSTINGIYYYNKPPLYNWLLVVLFRLFDSSSEWVIRMPTVVFLLSYAGTIFLIVRRHLGTKIAFVTAFAFITCGRILFYDSFFGLIDVLFSWITYLGFMVVYHYYQKEKWLSLFVISYLLTAIGFMLKGLPSMVFQGSTIVAFLFYTGNLKKLWSKEHVFGMLTFAAIIGGYFYVYSLHNGLETYFKTLWTESSKRTVMEHAWTESVLHVAFFPLDFVRHIVPWSLLVICCFRWDFMREVMANSFLKFNFIIFCATIPMYWLSPLTIPRYLFMLLPLFFTIVVYFYYQYQADKPIQNRIVEVVFLVTCAIFTLAVLIPPFVNLTKNIPLVWVKSLFLFVGLAMLTYLSFRVRQYQLAFLIVFLLLVRIGFNWFIFPARLQTSPEVTYRTSGIRVGQITKGKPLYLYKDTYVEIDISFYITRERGAILRADTAEQSQAFYIVEDRHLSNRKFRKYYDFRTSYQNNHLQLVQFTDRGGEEIVRSSGRIQ